MQITRLELLAPARNADIGIAAIDCGADAVYIAGPAFGARAAAGNAVEDIDRLCRYAHRYGAKVHATVNTLLTDEERPQALALMRQLYEAGVDVFIVQDLSLLEMPLPPVELHASTQTAIRTPERARELEALGFSRLVLERQLSLEEIRAIRAAVDCELEFFIHGALCVGYSGECYLSQQLAGRSANRGVCAQACRSRYDLVDASGRVIVRDRPLLSPRDLRFDKRLPDLVAAGICSFKIEGRLKNASYVKNVVRYYRQVMDDYAKTSAGRLEGGFTPDPDRTFQRGYTEAFLDGRGEKMASEDAAKSLGEFIGQIKAVSGNEIVIAGGKPLTNGDGLSFVGRNGEVSGRRVEVASGERIQLRDTTGLEPGMRIYRNFDIRFERELEKNMPKRVIDVKIDWKSEPGMTTVTATTEDELTTKVSFRDEAPAAEKPEVAVENLRRQLGKHTGPYAFSVASVEAEPVRFYPASFLNGLRRDLADELLRLAESRPRHSVPHTPQPGAAAHNVSTLDIPKVLLRSRYCIRWELGLCTKKCPAKPGMQEPLYLVNQGNRLRLQFDCKHCEMSIVAD
ncbi:MAG: U32 family peptidase [Bacteroidales bacterium]|nr:U32 family peptidase [Bacteroidales bacterium]